ncbi:MAG: IS66 family transposase [Nitrospirae bacterium]|nr:IS66 family transposase [Nitrospirota bacterium]
MQIELVILREQNTRLKTILQQNAVMIESKDIEIGRLEMELRLLRQKMYGPKSERMVVVDPEVQPHLFNEAEAEAREEVAEEIQVIQYERKKGGRRALPDNLPRIEEVHDIEEEDKVCGCGSRLSRIGEEVSEELDIIPRQCRVIRHIRPKYACRQCEGVESEKGAVQIAPAPVQLLPKTIATAGLIATVVVEKFADGLPLYRQTARFSREGIEISRGTLSNWVVRVGVLCSPLLEIFREELRAGPLINADETPVQVLNEPGRANTTKSYMWVFRGGRPPDRGGGTIVIFDYRPTRSGDEILKEYLTGYKGCAQSDGYIGYEVLPELSVKHAGCWAHVRRKFVEVVQAVEKAQKGKERRGGSADVAVSKIRRLYEIEQEAKNRELTAKDLLQFRREQALPLLQEFYDWLKARIGGTPPKGLLGMAMNYTLKQWPRLVVYVEDPYVGLDNNAAENAIRPFAVGRKNWLFAGSPAGARASANLYSLVETAKANGLEPYRYLRYVFEKLPYATTSDDYRNLTPLHLDRSAFNASLKK